MAAAASRLEASSLSHHRCVAPAGLTVVAVAVVLSLAAPLAAQDFAQDDNILAPRSFTLDDETAGDAPEAPTVTDKLREHVAAVVYCPVRTSKREQASAPPAGDDGEPTAAPTDDDPGCGAGIALRLTPRHWRRTSDPSAPPTRWVGGLFFGAHEFGPFVAMVALRTDQGAVGFGVGARIPFDSSGVDLSETPRLIVGMTASLAALRGGE